MDKSFSRFKRNIKQTASMFQSQINVRCATEESQYKTTLSKNTVPTIPELLCENDELRLQNQSLKAKVQGLQSERALLQKQSAQLKMKAQNSLNGSGSLSPMKKRMRIFQNAMHDLTQDNDRQLSGRNRDKSLDQNIGGGDLKNPLNNKKMSLSMRKSSHGADGRNKNQENVEEKFYKFIKDEITKIKAENSGLMSKNKQLQTQLHQVELDNRQLMVKLEEKTINMEKLNKEKINLQQCLQQKDQMIDMQTKCLENIEDTNRSIKNSILESRSNQQTNNIINKYAIQNQNLGRQLQIYKKRAEQYLQVKDDNYRLRNRVAELTVKCTEYYQKSYKYCPVIDHLWSIKDVELTNLRKTIQELRLEQN